MTFELRGWIRSYWPIGFLLLGTALAFGGQSVLLGTNADRPFLDQRQATAGTMLLLGALLFGFGARRVVCWASSRTDARAEPSTQTSSRDRWMAAAPSAILGVIAAVAFAYMGETLVVDALWLLSVVSLWLGPAWHVRLRPPRLSREALPYLLGLLVLLIGAVVTRTYHLTTIPYNVDQDFAAEGLQARAWATGEAVGIFHYGDRTAPMIAYLPPAVTMRLFGTGLAGLNASGVIEGILTILVTYLLGNELFDRRVGLIAAAVLVVSYAHLALSRQSGYIDPVFYMTCASYGLVAGVRRRHDGMMIMSGVFSALSVQAYWSGRLIIPLFGLAFVYALVFRWIGFRSSIERIMLWAFSIAVTLGPMLVVYIRQPVPLVSHQQQVFILSPELRAHMEDVYNVNTLDAMLREQARRTLFSLNYYTDRGTQFDFSRPFLDPTLSSLFVLGLGVAIFTRGGRAGAFVVAWVVLGLLFGVFLGSDPPYWGRLMIMLPALALLVALAVAVFWELIGRAADGLPVAGKLVAPAAFIFLILWLGIGNWNTYINVTGTYATPRTRIGRYLADQPIAARAYLVTGLGWGDRDEEFRFLAPGRLVGTLTPDQVQASLPRPGTPTLLVLTSDQADLAAQLPQLFTGGVLETGPGNSPGEIAFYAFRLP